MPSQWQHKLLWLSKPMKNTDKQFGRCLFVPRLRSVGRFHQKSNGADWSALVPPGLEREVVWRKLGGTGWWQAIEVGDDLRR